MNQSRVKEQRERFCVSVIIVWMYLWMKGRKKERETGKKERLAKKRNREKILNNFVV